VADDDEVVKHSEPRGSFEETYRRNESIEHAENSPAHPQALLERDLIEVAATPIPALLYRISILPPVNAPNSTIARS